MLSLVVSAIVSILTVLGIGTVSKLFWEDRHKKKAEETEEAKQRKKEERKKEIIEAVKETMNPCSTKIVESVQKIEKRLDLSEKCDQAVLRNSLMNLYYACNAKGFRTEDDSKNYREMHEAYNAVGGNSFIDSDVSRCFDNLPLRPNDYQGISTDKKKADSSSDKQ